MKNLKFWTIAIIISVVGVSMQSFATYQPPVAISTVTSIAYKDSTTAEMGSKVDSTFLYAIAHLKSYEGFRSKVYIDVDGSRTIGYGHHLLQGETYQNISDSLATVILNKDLNSRLEYIQAKYQISGDTLLAFGLFSFNCGTGTLAKAIQNGILKQPTKLLQYCHYKTYDSGGNATVHTSHKLLQRRQYELALITNKN